MFSLSCHGSQLWPEQHQANFQHFAKQEFNQYLKVHKQTPFKLQNLNINLISNKRNLFLFDNIKLLPLKKHIYGIP